jgi:hypothetical protein
MNQTNCYSILRIEAHRSSFEPRAFLPCKFRYSRTGRHVSTKNGDVAGTFNWIIKLPNDVLAVES